MSKRADALADRIFAGAEALASYAEGLSAHQWAMKVPGDGRTVGAVVHHVGSVYPIEVELAQALASGKPISGVTWAVIADMNAKHAAEHGGVSQKQAADLVRANAAAAAAAVRKMTDAELDSAAPVSLNADAPLTAQFFIEDHALRHSYHHLKKIRDTVGG